MYLEDGRKASGQVRRAELMSNGKRQQQNPNSSQKKRSNLYIDSKRGNESKVTQGEGWRTTARKSSPSTKSTIMIIVILAI
jgi:hypothetical protein